MKYDLDFFRGNTWTPVRELFSLQREMNRLFDGQFFEKVLAPSTHRHSKEIEFAPACDVEETDAQYLMSFDLPGVPKENVKIELHDRQLVVSGEKTEEHKEDSKTRHVTERFHGSFKRIFTLPQSVSAEKFEASYENGVLKIAKGKTSASASKETVKPKENGQSASRIA
jgi:HSP20 family protein